MLKEIVGEVLEIVADTAEVMFEFALSCLGILIAIVICVGVPVFLLVLAVLAVTN